MSYKFKSHRANLIQDYINYRGSLGYQYDNISIFSTMDKFFIIMNKTDFTGLTKEECEQWSQKRSFEKNNTQCIRINKMINFCKYLNQLGYSSCQPFPIRYIKNFKPYIFSKDEIKRIFKAADGLTCDKKHTCRNVLSTYFKLLYSTGIRKSEGLYLNIDDVNLKNGTILIRNSKNGKDRCLPLSSSMLVEMISYSNKYNLFANHNCRFFRNLDNKDFTDKSLSKWFVKILNEAEIPYIGGGHGPRIHDWSYANLPSFQTFVNNLFQV
jgi:site-specific recombinase XerD